MNTFRVIASSHEVRTTITEQGFVTFHFENIALPYEAINDLGSQGFVKYIISAKADLTSPETIQNTAHIYFDSNPAIVTNATEHILVDEFPTSTNDALLSESNIFLYPNPTAGHFYIELKNEDQLKGLNYSIVDLSGKLISMDHITSAVTKVSKLPNGCYFVKVGENGNMHTQKIIVLE